MTICDMHSDTLTARGKKSLFTAYNRSAKHNHLQFFAHFLRAGGSSSKWRRRETVRLHEKYLRLAEKDNIKTVKFKSDLSEDCRSMALFSIEGGGGLFADSEELYTLHRSGLRVMGICWDKNELSASSNEFGKDDFGLTEEGKALTRRLWQLGIVPDLSHMSDRATYELLSLGDGPVLATHSNFRGVCPAARNLTNGQAKEIAARGGLIGLNLYPPFLNELGEADIYDIIRHVDYALSLVGDETLALGLDIDGTQGRYPKDLGENESIHDKLYDELVGSYSAETLEKIFSKNALEFLKRTLPEKADGI